MKYIEIAVYIALLLQDISKLVVYVPLVLESHTQPQPLKLKPAIIMAAHKAVLTVIYWVATVGVRSDLAGYVTGGAVHHHHW